MKLLSESGRRVGRLDGAHDGGTDAWAAYGWIDRRPAGRRAIGPLKLARKAAAEGRRTGVLGTQLGGELLTARFRWLHCACRVLGGRAGAGARPAVPWHEGHCLV